MADQRHMSGSVTGGVADREGKRAESDRSTRDQLVFRRCQPGQSQHTEKPPLLRKSVVPATVIRMQPHRRLGGLPHRFHSQNVVDMGVGEPDRLDLEIALPRLSENPAVILPRIDHDRGAARWVPHQPTVLDERPGGDAERLGGGVRAHTRPLWVSHRSASSAAMQPVPAEVTAWR